MFTCETKVTGWESGETRCLSTFYTKTDVVETSPLCIPESFPCHRILFWPTFDPNSQVMGRNIRSGDL
jgi:hypothetical protein